MAVVLATNAIIALNDLKVDFLKIDDLETEHDDLLTIAINSASQKIEDYTRRIFKARSITQNIDGEGNDCLNLYHWPIVSLTSLTNLDTSIAIDTTGFFIDLEKGIIFAKGKSSFPELGYPWIQVIYQAGFSTIPWNIQEACIKMSAIEWAGRDTKRLGIISKNLADGSTLTYDKSDIPADIKVVLDLYARVI